MVDLRSSIVSSFLAAWRRTGALLRWPPRALSGNDLFFDGVALLDVGEDVLIAAPEEPATLSRLPRPPPAPPLSSSLELESVPTTRLELACSAASLARHAPVPASASTSTSVAAMTAARSACHGSPVDGEKGEERRS